MTNKLNRVFPLPYNLFWKKIGDTYHIERLAEKEFNEDEYEKMIQSVMSIDLSNGFSIIKEKEDSYVEDKFNRFQDLMKELFKRRIQLLNL